MDNPPLVLIDKPGTVQNSVSEINRPIFFSLSSQFLQYFSILIKVVTDIDPIKVLLDGNDGFQKSAYRRTIASKTYFHVRT